MPRPLFSRNATRSEPRYGSVLGLMLVALLAACSQLPKFDAVAAPPSTEPPKLVPIAGILAQADSLGRNSTTAAPVASRADALRARADRLRQQ